MASPEEVRPYTLAMHWLRWLNHPLVRHELDEASKELTRPPSAGRRRVGDDDASRYGDPFCNFGPTQLRAHASDKRAGASLAGRLTEPKHPCGLAATLPAILRPDIWLLALDPSLRLEPPRGGGRLPRQHGEDLWTVCELRLDPAATLTAAQRDLLRDGLLELGRDLSPRRHSAVLLPGLPRPTIGDPLAVSATAMFDGHLRACASTAGFPVVGRTLDYEPATSRVTFVVELDAGKIL